jgi:hypothetical protein
MLTDNLADAISRLKESPKFLSWGKAPLRPDDLEQSHIMAEKHYAPDELAALWGVSAETIRSIFRQEPGVLRITQPNEKKRKYVLTRIPHSVAERVHKRLSAVPQ